MKVDENYKIIVGLSMDSYKTKAEQNAAITSLHEARALGLKRKMAFYDTELEMYSRLYLLPPFWQFHDTTTKNHLSSKGWWVYISGKV